MIIKKARKGINRFGIRKYSEVKSKSQKDTKYDVGKVRIKNTNHYKYICTCPSFFNRQKPCMHIKDFIKAEKETQ